MIIRDTKTIGDKGRICLSPELLRLAGLKQGDKVYFDLTKSGNIVIKKYE
jgi:bifunctional DNA-binding transcriptional regulator/antitoxin component of YhaV-PrlF toxin-antitoxin module